MSIEPNEIPGEEEEFSFIQETIKKEPITIKKIANQAMKMAIGGIVFGFMASVGFFALKPWAETTFQKNPSKVTIPKDEEEEVKEKDKNKDKVVEIPELTVENLKQMTNALYEVAKHADRSIVEVRGIHGDEGWIKESYDTVNSVAGAIIADNGVELLVLADSSILKKSESIRVMFDDGNTYPAQLKKQDRNLGLAIFGVEKHLLKSTTTTQMQTAELGNSNVVRKGDTLIALGNPFGYSDGLGYGTVSSIKKDIALADGDYSLLLSDIPGCNKGSGFLVNIDGEIVGVIKPDITSGDHVNMTNALAISDIKEAIELLSNGQSVPYIGINGTAVTEQIEKEQGIPVGVYVKNVESDSPAMIAGIQSGDVITSVELEKVTTWNAYQNAILEYRAGDEIKLQGQRRGSDGYVEIEFNVTIGAKD